MGGSLEYSELQFIFELYPNYSNMKNFIETGTYKGDTCIEMSKHFEQVHTIEIVEKLYKDSLQRSLELDIKNIDFHHGDSVVILENVMKNINTDTVFFLDAHISGQDTSYNNKNFVPLLEELNVILKNQQLRHSLFILDDVRFWKGNEKESWDWEHIDYQNILDIFTKNNKTVFSCLERNDRFWILI